MDDQEWTHVVPKRATDPRKSAKYKSAIKLLKKDLAVSNHEEGLNYDGLAVEDVIKGFQPLSTSLMKSDFFELILTSLEKATCKEYSMMISLGIGNVLSSPSSLLQFALILCIRDSWQPAATDLSLLPADHSNVSKMKMQDGEINNDLKYQIFDPLFSVKESLICRTLGLFVSDENKKGKHKAAKGPTLFFMPHCPYRLYVNLLWENWANLENVIILGNR